VTGKKEATIHDVNFNKLHFARIIIVLEKSKEIKLQQKKS